MKQRDVRVSLGFVKLAITRLIAFCLNVVELMTGNAAYTEPFPTLLTVTAAITKLQTLAQQAADGGRQAMIDRNNALDDLLALMRTLAAYVQNQCQNSLSLLVSSGFEAAKTPTPVGQVVAPDAPALAQGTNSGTLKARTNKVYGASAHDWRIALAATPTVDVQTARTVGGRHQFSGLTPGLMYIVQVSALGAAGESDMSDSSSLMIT